MDSKPTAGRHLTTLTIVAPFFNEESGAELFHQTVCESLDSLDVNLGFVFVDDGSSDNTQLVLNKIADSDQRVTVLSFSRNFGHQIALTAGLDFAQGDAVVVMDSDLQHPPPVILDMVTEYLNGADIVYSVRRNDDNRGFLKSFVARIFYWSIEKAMTVNVISGAVDFRLMSRDVVSNLRTMREYHRFLRGMVPWLGFKDAVVYYDQAERQTGISNYTWKQLFRLARYGVLSFSTVPLDVITWFGLISTFFAFLYLIYALLLTLIMGRIIPGWTSTVIIVLFLGGVQLISIGVIAQYIGMIFEQVKQRPLYVLKQKRLAENHEAES